MLKSDSVRCIYYSKSPCCYCMWCENISELNALARNDLSSLFPKYKNISKIITYWYSMHEYIVTWHSVYIFITTKANTFPSTFVTTHCTVLGSSTWWKRSTCMSEWHTVPVVQCVNQIQVCPHVRHWHKTTRVVHT